MSSDGATYALIRKERDMYSTAEVYELLAGRSVPVSYAGLLAWADEVDLPRVGTSIVWSDQDVSDYIAELSDPVAEAEEAVDDATDELNEAVDNLEAVEDDPESSDEDIDEAEASVEDAEDALDEALDELQDAEDLDD